MREWQMRSLQLLQRMQRFGARYGGRLDEVADLTGRVENWRMLFLPLR